MRPRFPIVTAHAGCMGTRPNGAEHIGRALASGADVVELDIRLSADGHVLLSHEPDAVLPDGSRALLRGMSMDQIRALAPAGDDARILELGEAFDLMAGAAATLNLDAKEPQAAAAAAVVARGRGMADSLLFSGLEPEAAALLRDELRDFARLLNADPLLPASGYGLDSIRSAARIARECGCIGLNLDIRAASEALMGFSAPRGIPVFLWTADSEADMERALSLEPYSITTNKPDRLIELIRERAAKRH